MSGDYDDVYDFSQLARRRDSCAALWEAVHKLMAQAFADIEASRPKREEPDEYGPKYPAADAEEVRILRETTFEIVQTALLALGPPP